MTPTQCKAARTLLGIGQTELATEAKVNPRTVLDFETEKRVPQHSTLAAMEAALNRLGVEMIPENGGGAGVRLKARENDKDNG